MGTFQVSWRWAQEGWTVFKSPTAAPEGQSGGGKAWGPRGALRRFLGGGWQAGQKYDERFMNAARRTGAPHRSHGSPSRP